MALKFIFPFKTLMEHRKRLEELAQREFAEAQAIVQKGLREIDDMYRSIDEARLEITRLESEGNSDHIEQIKNHHLFMSGQAIRIERHRVKVRQDMAIAEEKQLALIEAAKEFKILEKIKEKKWAEFKDQMKKRELKQMDELAVTRFKKEESQK